MNNQYRNELDAETFANGQNQATGKKKKKKKKGKIRYKVNRGMDKKQLTWGIVIIGICVFAIAWCIYDFVNRDKGEEEDASVVRQYDLDGANTEGDTSITLENGMAFTI